MVVSSVVVVVVPEELELLDESSFFAQEIMVRLKQKISKMNNPFFIFSSIPKVKYYYIMRTLLIPRFGLFYKNEGFYLEGGEYGYFY